MSEYKKGKILIDVLETETTTLDSSNDVKAIDCVGSLKVINPSDSHRLWNLKLKVDENVLTNLPQTNNKEGLEPQTNWEQKYEVSDPKKPILQLTETIDSSKSEPGINHNFVVGAGDETTITLYVRNVSEDIIQDVVVNKQVPEYLKEVKISNSNGGETNLDLDTKKFVWKIAKLDPNETLSSTVVGRCEIHDVEIKSGNTVEVAYRSNMSSRSGIVPTIESLSDTMTGIDQEEDDSQPGKWNCEVDFDNESDFEVTVKSLKVSQKIATGEEILVDILPDEIVKATDTWVHKFAVSSVSVPALTSALDFTANYELHKEIQGTILKEDSKFMVLRTTTVKEINPPSVKANANTGMTITNTITNVGTSHMDNVKIKDIIPKDFEPPGIDQIIVNVLNESGEKKATLSGDNVTLKISPDNKESTSEHIISVEAFDLDSHLPPKFKLQMIYPIIARNPQISVKYETPVEIITHTNPVGPGYIDTTTEMPIIGIEYVKRKVKSAKSISPGAHEGAFNVTIKINNRGGVELQNISIIEEIPEGFTTGEFQPSNIQPEFSEQVGKESAKLAWKISCLDPNQAIKLRYVAEGTGEFPRTEPRIVIAQTDSMKGLTADMVGKGSGGTVAPEKASPEPETQAPADDDADVPVSAEHRVKCASCGSTQVGKKDDKSKAINYIGGVPTYAKLNYCKKCGHEWH